MGVKRAYWGLMAQHASVRSRRAGGQLLGRVCLCGEQRAGDQLLCSLLSLLMQLLPCRNAHFTSCPATCPPAPPRPSGMQTNLNPIMQRLFKVQPAPRPDDVNWPALQRSWWQRTVRQQGRASGAHWGKGELLRRRIQMLFGSLLAQPAALSCPYSGHSPSAPFSVHRCAACDPLLPSIFASACQRVAPVFVPCCAARRCARYTRCPSSSSSCCW